MSQGERSRVRTRSWKGLGESLLRSRKAVDDRAPGDTACRNCGTDAPGAFCPACGQETELKLPRASQFIREAAGRYVAFDGKMWRTLAALLLRPGFLTREYLSGRRIRYVRPARLVLVLAIVLFAAIRLFADTEGLMHLSGDDPPATKVAAGTGAGAPPARAAHKDKTIIEFDGEPVTIGSGGTAIEIDEDMNLKLAGVDSPIGQRISKRFESFNRLDRDQKSREIVAGMLRFGPYALIALLPAFALLMQVLYAGRSRRYPDRPRRYAEHLVYGAHSHAFVALVGTLAIAIPSAPVPGLLLAWGAVYLLWSMRAVYGGRWIGVFARALVASIVYSVLFGLAVAGLVFVAVLLR